jgi:hypothetical protein
MEHVLHVWYSTAVHIECEPPENSVDIKSVCEFNHFVLSMHRLHAGNSFELASKAAAMAALTCVHKSLCKT